jgi:hypothetical protein
MPICREELAADAARFGRHLTVADVGLTPDASLLILLSRLGEGRAVTRATSIAGRVSQLGRILEAPWRPACIPGADPGVRGGLRHNRYAGPRFFTFRPAVAATARTRMGQTACKLTQTS